MKIAAVGTGKWGTNIVRTLHSLNALACIVDLDPAKREALAEEFGVAAYASLADVPTETYQAVTIATPAEHHESNALEAFSLGKHAFVEKPIALNSAAVERMIKAANESGLTLMAGHLLLYQPAVAYLREQVRAGLIGDLRSIHVRRLNLGRARDVEDVCWSLGVHDIAVVLDLMQADPTDVLFVGDDFLTPGVADDTHLHLTFPGGVKAHIHSSWLWPSLERKTILVGSTGFLVFDEVEKTVVHHKKRIDDALQNVDEGEAVVFEGSGAPLTLELEHFIECCTTGKTPISNGPSALTVTQCLEKASPPKQ